MRVLVLALSLGLAACGASINVSDGDRGNEAAGSSGGGYTLEVRAGEGQQTYLILAPDGRTIGAHAAEGVSALIDGGRARALAQTPPPQSDEAPEVMSLRVPGFQMTIAGTEDDANGENGQVRMSFGGDGQNIVVHADEGGPGDADDRAYVRITGADEDAVRDFINDADELSPEVKAQMLAELGLQ